MICESGHLMRVWGIRNFYSNLERVAKEGSKFSTGYFVLVVASATLATGGLLTNSAAAIVGSMCVAPFLGPSRAACVGGIYRKWKTAGKGLIKQLFGLLVLGSATAFLVTAVFMHLAPEITLTEEIEARRLLTLKDVYLAMLVAVLSGFVSSFVLIAAPKRVSEPHQELLPVHYPRLLDVTIGIEIAVSLIPPASVTGIGLAVGDFHLSLHSLGLLTLNVVGLDIGGMIVLCLWRVEYKLLQLEKRIRSITEETINSMVRADKISTEIVLHSYKKADVHVKLHAFETNDIQDLLLAKKISEEIRKETGVSNNVRITVTLISMYESIDFKVLTPEKPQQLWK